MFNRKICITLGLLVGLAAPALAVEYVEVAAWSTILGPVAGPTSNFAQVVDGQTSFHFLTGNNSPRIVRVDNLNGAQTMAQLVSTAQWSLAGGTNNPAAYYGFSISGDYLQFGDTGTDAIWRVHKVTGAVTEYVSKAAIAAVTGAGDPGLLASADTTPTGEFVVYDGTSDSIIRTTGPGACEVFVSATDLTNATGSTSVSGGFTFDASGAMYFGNSTSKSMYKRATDGTISTVLTQAEIQAVAGGTSVSFKDLLFAPDGYLYFQDNSSGHMLRFLPANPVGSLGIFISKADLLAGPMASSNVIQTSWYNNNLAFHTFGTKGAYAVIPEPAALALGAVLGVLGLRRR